MTKNRIRIIGLAFASFLALTLLKIDVHSMNLFNSVSGMNIGGSYCDFRGGEMLDIAYSEGAFHEHKPYKTVSKCYFAYSDGGQSCEFSDQCQGECILPGVDAQTDENNYYEPKGLICERKDYPINELTCKDTSGECQEWPKNKCEGGFYWELIEPDTVKHQLHDCGPVV